MFITEEHGGVSVSGTILRHQGAAAQLIAELGVDDGGLGKAVDDADQQVQAGRADTPFAGIEQHGLGRRPGDWVGLAAHMAENIHHPGHAQQFVTRDATLAIADGAHPRNRAGRLGAMQGIRWVERGYHQADVLAILADQHVAHAWVDDVEAHVHAR
jgi:hypothetical protein